MACKEVRSQVQIRSYFFHQIGQVEGSRCPACGHHKEDTKHFLLDCPSYAHKRWLLYRQSKTTDLNLKTLLSKKMAAPVANYIQATGRFEEGGDGQEVEEQ